MSLSIKGLPIQRSWVLGALAIIIGLTSAFGVRHYIQSQMAAIQAQDKARATVRVVVPQKDLPKGSPLQSTDVAVREVPAQWAHANAILEEQYQRVEGQRLAYPAVAGQMVLWSMLEGQRAAAFSARLTSGLRAITVPVDEVNSISGMLQPGDRIDLMLSAKRDNQPMLITLLQNIPVVATGSQAAPGAEDGKEGRRTYTTITLEVTPQDAQRVLAGRELGKLAALLRAPGDVARAYNDQGDALALLGLSGSPKGKPQDGIPVLYGGRAGAESLKDIPPIGRPATREGPAMPVQQIVPALATAAAVAEPR